jgi:hypothetical protein
MKSKLQIFISVFLLGYCSFAEDSFSADRTIQTEILASRVEMVRGLGDLCGEFLRMQEDFLPVLPPGLGLLVQSDFHLIAFDPSGFDVRFLKGLIGERDAVSGAPIYTVFAMEDAISFETVFYNVQWQELVRVPQVEKYNPFSWAEERFGENLTKELMALYDPARVVSVFRLIPEADYAEHVDALAVAESEALDAESLAVPMVFAMSSTPPNLQLAISNTTNDTVEIEVSWPTTFTNRLDIFACSDLMAVGSWSVAASGLSTTGLSSLVWEDTDMSDAVRHYRAGNADLDSDGDGLADAAELVVWNSLTNSVDSDADGYSDYAEVTATFRTDPMSADTTSPSISIVSPVTGFVVVP